MKLYEHQLQALKDSENLNHVAYYHDMGLGKTFTGAEKLKRLGARVNLVICQKSKIDDWMDHFMEYYNCDFLVFDLTNKTDFKAFMSYRKQEEPYDRVGIINYELAFRRPELLDLSDFTLMLDESSIIQNETAKQSKFVLKLGSNAANVILLSGTPTGGKYENLWSQLNLLGWGISKKLYMRQYVDVEYLDMLNISIPIIKGYKNVERLKEKMRAHGCQFLKTEEVFDLPEQIFNVIKVDTTKEYRMFRKNRIVQFNDIELVGDTTLTRLLCERQLCAIYNNAKLEAFKDLLESTQDNFIVFYNFNAELEALKSTAEACGREIGMVNGSGKINVNYSLNHNFVLFIQYQAGARGGNYQAISNRVIFNSLPLSSELFEQAKKRIHRIGQNKTCFYSVLLCKNSVEERIYKTLLQRKDFTERLFESEQTN